VIYKYDPTNIRKNVGVEKLLVDIVTAGPDSENHAVDAITFVGAEDSWLRDATMQHFVHAGVQFTNSTRCTVERSRAIEPHSIVTGERRYNFSTYHAQLILFRDCFASFSRHAFVTNGTTTDSGNVALNSTIDHNLTFAEAHRRWSTGLLFDHLVAVNRSSGDVFGFYNRGNYGTGHGWATGHSVIWNTDASGGRIVVQQPPTAQNYAIGCAGNVTGSGPFAGPPGYQEGSNTPGLQPASLYLEQVAQRLSDGSAPDVTAPLAPTLSSTGSNSTSVGLSWTASADDIGVYGYDVFMNGAFAGFTTDTALTVGNLNGDTAYTFTVYARDAAGNLSLPGNAVTVTTAPGAPVRPAIVFEAESLAFTTVGANASVATETFSSGGQFASNFQYVSLGADGNPPPPGGELIDFALPNIPAGTYTLVMRYKTHQANRGILQLSVDGQPLGSPLNQHSSPATFRETTFGIVRFAASGDHTVRLTVTGRDATAAAYTITADVFTLRPDNAAPLISAPADQTLEAAGPDGAVATYTGSATDVPDGPLPVTFTPPSGSTFPIGTTPVVATAQDFAGNRATATFDITVVDTTPPALLLPGDLVLEATGPSGAVATFAASANDAVSGAVGVSLSQDSGSTFPLGTTTVTATATDDFDNMATATFNVTVVDTTAPAITVPGTLTVEATSAAGAVVAFNISATDLVSPVTLSVSQSSGTVFPLGTTAVTVAATDAANNTSIATFDIQVVDTTAPTLSLPANLIVEATGPGGAAAVFAGSAVDVVSGSLPVVFTPPSGSLFPLGTTTVSATATDAAGHTAVGQFTVTVRDTTPPVLTLPAQQTLETNNPTGAVATFSGSAQDVVSGSVSLVFTPPSGSLFPLGTTTVTAAATDAAGNRASGTFTITVRVAAWATGVSYKIGSLAVYQGTTWKCIQAHRSQSDWTPPRTPALWVKVPTGNQWDYPVEYAVGSEVIYNGLTYRCLQAHISQAGWTPAATPALWRRN
jgi:chitodextrinase